MRVLTIIGNLGADAKIGQHEKKQVINFSVAVNESYVNADGVVSEKTEWVECSKWVKEGGSTKVASYLKKGTQVYVSGLPGLNMYDKKDGGKGQSQTLTVRELKLLGGVKD
jgi:single-strand DNA-binding protein